MEINNIIIPEHKELQKKFREVLPVLQETESYNFIYPEFAIETDKQIENNHWKWTEIDVEKDKQDFKVKMDEKERYAIIFALKLFFKYEIILGDNFWSDRFMKIFKRPEFHRKAIWNAHQELNVHAPFYIELNKQLGLTTDEFYLSYLESPALKQRVRFIGKMLNHNFDLYALAASNMIEGAGLYTNFSLFKRFQVNGRNKLSKVVSGTDQSVLDENNHAYDSANGFKIIVKEAFERKLISKEEWAVITETIYKLANIMLENEEDIFKNMFPMGEIEDFTKFQAMNFMKLRLNECLVRMGFEPIFKVEDKTIFNWFKTTTSLYSSSDSFFNKSREYRTGFNYKDFKFVDVSNLIAK